MRLHIYMLLACVGVCFVFVYACAFGRAGEVAVGSTAGAAVGSVAGPVGALVGAAVGGGMTHAIVENQQQSGRIDDLEAENQRLRDALARAGGKVPEAPTAPTWWQRIPWWGWISLIVAWLKRAHLIDMLTGNNPRLDAFLRLVGLRTANTPVPEKPQ